MTRFVGRKKNPNTKKTYIFFYDDSVKYTENRVLDTWIEGTQWLRLEGSPKKGVDSNAAQRSVLRQMLWLLVGWFPLLISFRCFCCFVSFGWLFWFRGTGMMSFSVQSKRITKFYFTNLGLNFSKSMWIIMKVKKTQEKHNNFVNAR